MTTLQLPPAGLWQKFKQLLTLKNLLWAAVLLILTSLLFLWTKEQYWDFRDKDPGRGAAADKTALFNDKADTIQYLEQNWSPKESLWFYTTSQGSDLLPYDLFMALNMAGTEKPFNSEENIQRWRYLPQYKTSSNPDALPVGFVKDTYKNRNYIGFSCAACHTTQINYKGTGLRIDGGPTMADMDTFMRDLAKSLKAITPEGKACTDKACQQFVQRVLDRQGDYSTSANVVTDLKSYAQRINTYVTINHSPTDYGYARLDAFGRIYNRVLEHVLLPKDLDNLLPEIYADADLQAAREALAPVISSADPLHTVERALSLLPQGLRTRFLTQTFNPPNAPVSYPFLWDIAQHDYVQWNGLAANAGLGPVGRNSGEVIGVFGTLDFRYENKFSLTSLLSGQGLNKRHISYESSVNVHNLRRIESQLKELQSPLWPENVLGRIDRVMAARGKNVFAQYCAACHAEINRTDKNRRVVANLSGIDVAKTDPTMAQNSTNRMGFSGFLRNEYASLGVGDILIDQRAPVAAILTNVTQGVVVTPYPADGWLQRSFNWLYDLGSAYFSNEIKPSIKRGDYTPDTTTNPLASLQSYKGRSLNGIWATAPYLHNGSVPTLYDLLLPQSARPSRFTVGSREFDPKKVGFVTEGYSGFVFDTQAAGNSNAGHEYGTPNDPTLEKNKLKPLTEDQRRDLIEYMKAL